MLWKCFKNHIRLAGCTIATLTTASELTGLGFYLFYYAQYVSKESKQSSAASDFIASLQRGVDPGALIGVSIMFFTVLFCNILLFYGVWRRKLLCFLPWLLLHAALFLEALLALGFCIAKSIRMSTFYSPLVIVLIVVVFIFVVWLLIKELFLALYSSSRTGGNNGSDFSRDQILEMQSFVHSSPRVSYVTAMTEGIHRVAL